MGLPLTADDLLPLVSKLPHDQQVRLAKLALHAAAQGQSDAHTYRSSPPAATEFGTDEDPLAWESDGWEDVSEAR